MNRIISLLLALLLTLSLCITATAEEDSRMKIISCPEQEFSTLCKPGYPWKTRLVHLTSSGEGLRLVSEIIPGAGNIADQQYLQAKELGMLNVKGTTGKWVTDNSCINADKLSFCPRLEDILYIDEDRLFNI